MKKETIEEFIKEVLNEEFFTNISEYRKAERLMELSAKWQQEKSYSQLDVVRILSNSLHSVELKDNKDYSKIYNNMKEWFEKFKKK